MVANDAEEVPFSVPLDAKGNVEDYLGQGTVLRGAKLVLSEGMVPTRRDILSAGTLVSGFFAADSGLICTRGGGHAELRADHQEVPCPGTRALPLFMEAALLLCSPPSLGSMLSYLDASLAFLGARQPLLVTSTRRHCVLTCVRHAVLSVFVSGAGVHSGSAVRLDVEDDRRADAREGRQVGHAAVVDCALLSTGKSGGSMLISVSVSDSGCMSSTLFPIHNTPALRLNHDDDDCS
eukprot:3931710-Rhodomonas_salina.4